MTVPTALRSRRQRTSRSGADVRRNTTLRRGATALIAGVLLAGAAAPAGAAEPPAPVAPSSSASVVLDGLNSPKGLDSFLDVPIFSAGAFGPPGPVAAAIKLPWSPAKFQVLSSDIALVDVAVAPDASLWGLGADQKLYRKSASSKTFKPVADIAAYQVTDPDPTNTEGEATESNPFGLAVLPNGQALVTDAANNDLLKITPAGQITTVARFGIEMISTDHLGDPELPPMLPTEAVPTSVTVAKDGIYVGELKGFPFRPGSSRIWKIDPKAVGATCAVEPAAAAAAAAAASCSVAHSGFTAIQDIEADTRTGRLYVYELAAAGVLAFEGGFETGEFPPAVLLEVAKNGTRTELAAGQLSQPGGIDVGVFGSIHVTDGVFGNGRLLKIKR